MKQTHLIDFGVKSQTWTASTIITKFKDDPSFGPDLDREMYNDSHLEQLVKALEQAQILHIAWNGFHRLTLNESVSKQLISKLIRDAQPGYWTTDSLWDSVRTRDNIRVYQGALGTILDELEKEGSLHLDRINTTADSHWYYRLWWSPDGVEKKQEYQQRIGSIMTELELTKLSMEIEDDQDTRNYRFELLKQIDLKKMEMLSKTESEWFEKTVSTQTEIETFERFYSIMEIRDRDELIKHSFEVGYFHHKATGLVTTNCADLKWDDVEFNEIQFRKILSKQKLSSHNYVFGVYSPDLIWRSYKILGSKGTKFYIPSNPAYPMMMQKNEIKLYIAPQVVPINEDENTWYIQQRQDFLSSKPDYERGK